MAFLRSGDGDGFRKTVLKAAQKGNLAAELFLAEQYIPEQCSFEPNQDVPHCGKNGKEAPSIVFRENPLKVEASYEEAARWLEKASAQGSGEASEVLAQLITRMQANGHGTSYTAADSARFHALARSQGFDVEPLSVTCWKLKPGGKSAVVEEPPFSVPSEPQVESFTRDELAALTKAGILGALFYREGGPQGEAVLLTRPEGVVAHIRVVLDHKPGSEILLPLPAHHDVIYVQHGDEFLAFPGIGKVLPRFIALDPQKPPGAQILIMTQSISGSYGGASCGEFP